LAGALTFAGALTLAGALVCIELLICAELVICVLNTKANAMDATPAKPASDIFMVFSLNVPA
jgi:NADH:ubiquinone oxidoreductase subunit K